MTEAAVWSDRGGGGVSSSLRNVWYEAAGRFQRSFLLKNTSPTTQPQLLQMWKDDLMQLFQQSVQLI